MFIHEAVLEALLCGETLVAASDLVRHYDELITVDPQTHLAPIQEEFEVCFHQKSFKLYILIIILCNIRSFLINLFRVFVDS